VCSYVTRSADSPVRSMIMVVRVQRAQWPVLDEDLPEYLAPDSAPQAPDGPGVHDGWDAARRVALSLRAAHRRESAAADLRWIAPARPPGHPTTADPSGRFFLFVGLPCARLGPILAQWWATHAYAGVVTVDGKLRLEPPQGDGRGGFTVCGRVRRFTRWHWVPVVIELWPRGAGTIMTMTPRDRVVASRRHFRTGHLVLERFTAQLSMSSARSNGARPAS